MDFSTVYQRLENNLYTDPDTFVRDVRLIFSNSRAYNTMPRSRVSLSCYTFFQATLKSFLFAEFAQTQSFSKALVKRMDRGLLRRSFACELFSRHFTEGNYHINFIFLPVLPANGMNHRSDQYNFQFSIFVFVRMEQNYQTQPKMNRLSKPFSRNFLLL